MRRTTTNKKCKMCETEMSLPFWLSITKNFCSNKCSGRFTRENKRKIMSCLTCKKEFRIQQSKEKKFCSHKCYSKTLEGKIVYIGGMTGYRKDINLLAINEKKHLDTQYRQWMFSVKKRDNWKCRIAD